jgi:hypothetical protein
MYQRVLDLIRDHMNPQTIGIDFEKAAENAFRSTFPAAQMHGCHFHYCQCIYRKANNLGWSDRYKTDHIFATTIQLFMCLSFLNPNDVINVYTILFNLFKAIYNEEYG